MGVIMWDHAVIKKETILFSDNLTAPELKSKIGELVVGGGGTKGGIALKETFATLFNSHGNPDVYQNAIFLSDGDSQDDIVSAAENFHRSGIRLTSVALGRQDNWFWALMKKITGFDRNPPLNYKNFYFQHSDAVDLASHAKDMRKEILDCEGKAGSEDAAAGVDDAAGGDGAAAGGDNAGDDAEGGDDAAAAGDGGKYGH